MRQPSPEFLQSFRNIRKALILGHINPDADSLGSSIGLASALCKRGVNAIVGIPLTGIPKRLSFMFTLDRSVLCVHECSPTDGYDAVIIVDTASAKRINAVPGLDGIGDVQRFNIDHHITNTDYGAHNWVDPHASSTCELIARLISLLGGPIGPATASLLYSGIHGDTAGFSLPSTTGECLRIASDLVNAGADVAHIGEQLCRSQGRHDFELLRRVYDHTTVVDDGRIAYSFLTHRDIVDSGCRAEDIDDQVSIPRALRGVQIAMLFSEGEPGVVRINLRGEGNISILDLAQKFGGGGHAQSAGVRVRGKPLQEVIDTVVTEAVAFLEAS